jgi:hypothetical protein
MNSYTQELVANKMQRSNTEERHSEAQRSRHPGIEEMRQIGLPREFGDYHERDSNRARKRDRNELALRIPERSSSSGIRRIRIDDRISKTARNNHLESYDAIAEKGNFIHLTEVILSKFCYRIYT